MARRAKNKPDEQPLKQSSEASTEQGLSLDELSQSFERLLGEAESTDESINESINESTDGGTDKGPAFAVLAAAQDAVIDPANAKAPDERESDACPVSPRNIVEAILFVGHPNDESLSARNIAALMRGVRAVEVEALIEQLNEEYIKHNCPYIIESVGGGFRMVLGRDFDSVRERFYGRIRQAQLTQTAINTLAIVAYNQPLEKKQIVELSGEASTGRVLSQLVRRGLVSVERLEQGASNGEGSGIGIGEKPKKRNRQSPILYRTTDRFLDLFGLAALSDLPRNHDLSDDQV